jgi:hypothetical protein
VDLLGWGGGLLAIHLEALKTGHRNNRAAATSSATRDVEWWLQNSRAAEDKKQVKITIQTRWTLGHIYEYISSR